MDADTEKLVDECETSWESRELTVPNVVLDDLPLKELIAKAHHILASESHGSLDALVCRIADVIPGGVTEENFGVSQPLAKVCKKWLGQVEKFRMALKRPALDWGKAVDTAAKEWTARAEPTLLPIINRVKQIEDRKKAEKLAAEAKEAKRIEDERLAAEKAAERAKVKAEQDAENARLAAIAEANRVEAEKLASERKEIEEMKRWLAEREAKTASKEDAKAIVEAPDGKMIALGGAKADYVSIDEAANWPPTLLPDFDNQDPVPFPSLPTIPDEMVPKHDPLTWPPAAAKMTNDELQAIMSDAETSAEFSKAGVQVNAAADQQKVREFANKIAEFANSIQRPNLVKHEARQAVELALFDICEIVNRLHEWRMP